MRVCGWPVTLIILLTLLALVCGKVDNELALDKRQLDGLGSLLGDVVPSDTTSAKKTREKPTHSSSGPTDTPSPTSDTSSASTSHSASNMAATKPPASQTAKAVVKGSSTTTLVALSTSHVSKIS